jgi:hypothetical protein
MYGWIWQRLPGSTYARAAAMTAMAIVVAAALWFFVFPWAASHLPIDGTAFSG